MKRFLAPVLFLVASLSWAGETPSPKDRSLSDAENEVRAAVRAVREATAKRDRAALERLLTDTFTGLMPVGSRHDRAEWIDRLAKGNLLMTQKADETEELGEELTLHAAMAATHTTLWRFQVAATKRDVCLQNRTVYAKLAGEWRVISSQGSMIHDGPLVAVSHDGLTGKYEIEGGGTYTVTKTGRTLFGLRSGLQESPSSRRPMAASRDRWPGDRTDVQQRRERDLASEEGRMTPACPTEPAPPSAPPSAR